MERKRLVTALMIVLVLGLIISAVGKFAAVGIDLGETTILAFDTAILGFFITSLVVAAAFEQYFSEAEPEAEQDGTLY